MAQAQIETSRDLHVSNRRHGEILQFRPRATLPEGLTTPNIAPEQLQELTGFQQESVFISLIENGNLKKVDGLWKAMNALEPLDMLRDDRRVALWTWQSSHSPKPITPDNHEEYFGQLNRTVPSLGKEKLAQILERERQRAIEFAPGMFFPMEDIGIFTAPRRYFTILSEFVRWEKESKAEINKRISWDKPVIIFDSSLKPSKTPTPLHS